MNVAQKQCKINIYKKENKLYKKRQNPHYSCCTIRKNIGGADVFMSKRNNSEKRKTKEEDTMSATARNFVYEVKAKDSKKILSQPAVSKSFLEDCKKVAQKYRKKS